MRARLTAFALACALGAMLAAGASATSTKHHRKKRPPKFNMRYDCARVAPAQLIDSFLSVWEGNVALKGKPTRNVFGGGGGSGCTYKYADGPFVGQFAGSVIVEYGPKSASAYKSGERGAQQKGAEACADGNPSGDMRVCGPVEVSGVGSRAYEASYYIAALKGKFFVQLLAGPGVSNGDWVPSSRLPPADALEKAEKAILAKLH